MGFSGLGRGCPQAWTHKPKPKSSRCGGHCTEGQAGPCSRLTRGMAASFHGLTPSQEWAAQPHEVPPSSAANCQALQSQDVSSNCTGEREHRAERLHSEGCLAAMASSPCSHRTEPGLKAFPCLPRSLVLLHLNGTVSALCTIPKLPLSYSGQLFLQAL